MTPRAGLTLLVAILAAAAGAEARQLSQQAAAKPSAAPAAPAAKPAATPAAKPALPPGVPAAAAAPDTLYVQTARKATLERMPDGDYKLVMTDVNPVTLWISDRPSREAGALRHDQFMAIIGGTKSNPVNGALVTSATDVLPARAVPIQVHDGAFKNGQLVWYGRPLEGLKAIATPGASRAGKLKPGEKLELLEPSLFLDGAANRMTVGMAGVEAGFESGGDAAAIASAGNTASTAVGKTKGLPDVDMNDAKGTVGNRAVAPDDDAASTAGTAGR